MIEINKAELSKQQAALASAVRAEIDRVKASSALVAEYFALTRRVAELEKERDVLAACDSIARLEVVERHLGVVNNAISVVR